MTLNKKLMKLKNYIGIVSLIALIALGCKKSNFDTSVNGEALGAFKLAAPATSSKILLNAATPNQTIEITWTAAKPGISTMPKYSWIVASKSGSLDAPLLEIASNNTGADTKLTLTYKQLDDALKAKGVADGATTDFIWSVSADNGKNSKVRAEDVFNLTVTRFKDGATPFILLGPTSSATSLEINPSSTTDNFKFNWTKSAPANAASPVKYTITFYTDDAAATPVFSSLSNTAGADTLYTISYKSFSDSLTTHGFSDFSVASKLKWKVTATSGTWNQVSDYSNQFYLVRLVRMYLVGSMTGWDINAPWEMVADKAPGRLGKVFYSYVRLGASDAFKFVKEIGNWNSAYGNTGGSAGSYTTAINSGGDFSVSSAGIYRLTLDLTTGKAYVQQKQVGVVGNMQGWNAAAPNFGGIVGRNKFIIITNSNNDDFKFHDGTEWDNSAPNKSRWWGKGAATGLLDVDGNGGNLTAASNPRTRAIWDASDPQQVKYDLTPAVEMRVVGDGMNVAGVNDWDPPTSPQMTYVGNGRWQISIVLKANKDIKFLAGNAWGALDYEDAGGTTVNSRTIKWDGSNNFKTPAVAGTYTIILDEHAQTVTIN
jgi:hypothetical protein